MGGRKGGPNAKQAAGRALKAENEAKKKAELDRQKEGAEAKSWQVGANSRKANRDEQAALKKDEQARKAREKADLLAQEEAETASGKIKKTPKLLKKGKKKTGNLDLLEESLQSDAAKKMKKKKQDALKKQQEQEAQRKAKEEQAQQPVDPLMANTNGMLGIDGDDADVVGREANKARMEQAASGLDAALDNLSVKVETKSNKALYAEYEARMLPQVKSDFPGLRLSQYKDKVFQMWKKSPDNPINQVLST